MDYIREFFARMGHNLGKLIKAKVIATGLSLIVLLLGFYYLKVPYWPLVALAIALVDLLPFVGSALVLLPWAMISLAQSQSKLALGLVIIFIISFLIHQIAEPLLIGKEVGIKPLYAFLITIGSMVLFGPWGAIIGSLITLAISAYGSMKSFSRHQ